MKGRGEISETTPVRIGNDVLTIVRLHKDVTGVNIQRFVEEAIIEKVSQLPIGIQDKMGLKKVHTKYIESVGAFVIKESNKKKK